MLNSEAEFPGANGFPATQNLGHGVQVSACKSLRAGSTARFHDQQGEAWNLSYFRDPRNTRPLAHAH